MTWEYFHLIREESTTPDWVDSEFLNQKGKEGWELVNVFSIEKERDTSEPTSVSMKMIKEREWHYYFKRPVVEESL